jgi:undecaprenyl-diphosphatase
MGSGHTSLRCCRVLPLVVAAGLSLYAGTAIPFLGVLALEAAVMGLARITAPDRTVTEEPTWSGAALMGFAQAIAIFPGISRSGSTVVTGLWRRIDPVAAAEFSFLMSVPAILGAAVLQVPDALTMELAIPTSALLIGFIAAAASGVLAIRFFVALLRRQNFHIFAYYCWVVAGLFLLFA